jgi:hypothetical protein
MNTTGRKTVKGEKVSAPKAVKASTKKSPVASATEAAKLPPSHEEIAMRSYELYLQRGAVDGYHEQDWLQAEAELLSR